MQVEGDLRVFCPYASRMQSSEPENGVKKTSNDDRRRVVPVPGEEDISHTANLQRSPSSYAIARDKNKVSLSKTI